MYSAKTVSFVNSQNFQILLLLSGVSRISVRGVLKVRPHTKSGGGGGGGSPLQVQYTKSWGWGGGGAICFRSDSKCEGWGGGGSPLQVRYLFGTQKIRYRLIINGYNFDRGGCSSTLSPPPPGYATELCSMSIGRACK